MTITDVNEHARVHYGTVKKYFGGLRAALRQAGLQANEFRRGISRDDLLDELERVWDITATIEGRPPYKKDLRVYGGKYGYDPYYRVFGSWIMALQAVTERDESAAAAGVSGGGHDERHVDEHRRKTVPLGLRVTILKRDKYSCRMCGRSPGTTPHIELHVDHIVPVVKGGTNAPENLQTLCNECNVGKGAL